MPVGYITNAVRTNQAGSPWAIFPVTSGSAVQRVRSRVIGPVTPGAGA